MYVKSRLVCTQSVRNAMCRLTVLSRRPADSMTFIACVSHSGACHDDQLVAVVERCVRTAFLSPAVLTHIQHMY